MRSAFVIALVLALVLGASNAHAQQAPDREGSRWVPKRQLRVGTGDLITTGAAAGVALGSAIIAPFSKHATGGVFFDEDARDALRLRSMNARYTARDASDVGISLEITWPFLVDALVTAWWYRGNAPLARDMAIVSAETLTLTAAVQGLTADLTSRQRPYGRLCGTELAASSPDCSGAIRYRSFFSGHSANSFAAASMMCVHHLGMGLLGAPWDAVACGSSLSVATATSLFRVMSDMHYASDVIVGAVVGGAIGVLVPALHLTGGRTTTAGRVEVRVAPVGQGLGLMGSF
jgi:membrane-associated phospholipid phosphatase